MLEADFTRSYGTDLRLACWGPDPWGCRRILVHVCGLPTDSATTRRRLNAPMGWDNTTELTASAVDAVNRLTRLFYNANFEDPLKDLIPLMPRPYQVQPAPAEAETITLTELGNLLGET